MLVQGPIAAEQSGCRAARSSLAHGSNKAIAVLMSSYNALLSREALWYGPPVNPPFSEWDPGQPAKSNLATILLTSQAVQQMVPSAAAIPASLKLHKTPQS